MNMKETLRTIGQVYGPSGREDQVRAAIREQVAPFVDTIDTDAMGNLICVKKGNGPRVMVAAHMDQIGFVVTDIDKNGFLRVHNVGGVYRRNSILRPVVFENGVRGVVAHEYEDFKADDHTLRQLFIDIGAADRAEAEAKVSIGDMAVYAPDYCELSEDRIAGPSMDDRAGCAVLVETLRAVANESALPYEIVAVFTVQEEVGLRGAATASHAVLPAFGIALDVTFAGDTPKGFPISVELAKGPAIKIMDSSLVVAPAVVRAMEAAAARAHVVTQREVLIGGGTDAGQIQLSGCGVPSGVLSIPCRYVHSATEVVSIRDMEGAVALLTELLRQPI